jgi:microcystin-dependent protein
MATTLNAGTTAATALNVITDTTGAMAIQTSGTTAIAINNAQVVSLTNPLLPVSGGTGLSSLGTGVATFLGTPSSANLLAAVTDETGTGSLVFGTAPTISSANLTGTPVAPTAAVGTNTTQIATTAFVQAAGLVGEIKMWGTASAPTGYLLCDGSAVSRTTYAALFAVVGTTFGVGDGSTTFTLPDYRGRTPIGVSGSYALAATGGSADAVVVSHGHGATVTDPGHAHPPASPATTFWGNNASATTGSPGGGGSAASATTGSAVTGVSVAVGVAGVSGVGANLQPYLAINFIIKT